MQSFGAPLRLKDVTERNLSEIARPLRGYVKFTSVLWIRAAGQPILDGVIVGRWSKEAESAIKTFCRSHGYSEMLLRTDALNERWSTRRGGYIIPQTRARAVMREINGEGKIGAFLEPLSPYRDLYCRASITDDQQNNMTVEVVGPGFDTSDLLRSDVSPHERFEVSVPHHRSSEGRLAIRRTHTTSTEGYLRTVDDRLVKIGARLKDPAYPINASSLSDSDQGRLKNEAVDFLKQTGQTLLLRHSNRYRPIPQRFLRRFINGVGAIIDHLDAYSVNLGPMAFSGTITTRGRFLFWDFFPADSSKAMLL